MKVPSLNLGEWLERLGVRRPGWAPEMLETIQPVHVVGDAGVLVPPLLPPTAYSGGSFTSNVARTWCCELASISGGGAFVRGFRLHNTAAAIARWRVQPAPGATFFAPQIGTNYDVGPTPVQSVFRVGDTAAPITAVTDPILGIGANGSIMLDDWVFVPPGFVFYVEHVSAGPNSYNASIAWQEAPVA